MSLGTVEVAKTVSREVKVAAAQVVESEGPVEISEILRDKQAETFALVLRLLASAGLSAEFSLPGDKEKKDKIAVRLADAVSELSPETLELCLQGLETDYKNGIVVLDHSQTVDYFRFALAEDKTAGTSWDTIKERLLKDGSKLLKRAAQMQGKGQFIGVYHNGDLCIKDRGTEPVIFGQTAEGRQITITTDTPNRDAVMQSVRNGGQFANYWEIRAIVRQNGFTLPPDSPDLEKQGIIAAVEVITDTSFVCSENGKESRSAILECGNVPTSSKAVVHVMSFNPNPDFGDAGVSGGFPQDRYAERGAVRLLRG